MASFLSPPLPFPLSFGVLPPVSVEGGGAVGEEARELGERVAVAGAVTHADVAGAFLLIDESDGSTLAAGMAEMGAQP